MDGVSTENVPVNIKPLLQSITPGQSLTSNADGQEIALAISRIFTSQLSAAQTALLLDRLALTGLDQRPDVLAKCAVVMREAAEDVDASLLQRLASRRDVGLGAYKGGLCDIVGTGGDGHSTFNISTASSILASSLLRIAKHGNRASTSRSGSAEVLSCMKTPYQPRLESVTAGSLLKIYERTNYCFLFAPNFHKALKNVASIRKELPGPSIFNLLGPLTNPAGPAVEASLIGVKAPTLVPVFAEAMRLNGAKRAMIVSGMESLDEISCAGPTRCAMLVEHASSAYNAHESRVDIDEFMLKPEDFGFAPHSLLHVSPGLTPEENASILSELLVDHLSTDNPILQFVLMNTAALFAISGVCDVGTCPFKSGASVLTETGPGGCRWKEGVRLARLSIQTSKASQMLKNFADFTNDLSA